MRRVGTSGGVVLAALCGVVSLAACGPSSIAPLPESPFAATAPAGPDGATVAPSGPATPGLPGTPAPGAALTPGPAEWKTFTTADGLLMFDHPPDWVVKDRSAEAAPGGVFVEVLSGAGKSMATLRTNMAIAAECAEKSPYALMDSEELPALAQAGSTPRFVFEGRSYPGADPATSNPLAYGITSAPPPSGPTACPIFHFFTWPPSAAAFGGVYNPHDASTGNTPQVDSPEAYTGTGEYDDIRAMITSLRPLGK